MQSNHVSIKILYIWSTISKLLCDIILNFLMKIFILFSLAFKGQNTNFFCNYPITIIVNYSKIMNCIHNIANSYREGSQLNREIINEGKRHIHKFLILKANEAGSDPLLRVKRLRTGSVKLCRQILDLCGGDLAEFSLFTVKKKKTETVTLCGNQSAYEVAWGPHEKNEEPNNTTYHLLLKLYPSLHVVVFVIKTRSQMTKKDSNVCLKLPEKLGQTCDGFLV